MSRRKKVHPPNIIIRKRGPSYQIDYYWHGQRHRRTFPTMAGAEAAKEKILEEIRREIRGEIRRHMVPHRPETRTYLEDAVEEYIRVRVSTYSGGGAGTISSLRTITERLGVEFLEDVDAGDIEAYIPERLEEVKPSTVNREVASLSGLYSTFQRWGRIEKNPCKAVRTLPESAPRDRVLSKDEETRLLHAADRIDRPKLPQLIVLALRTGARRSEIVAAEWDHIDLDRRSWRIPQDKSGKGGRIPLSGDAVTALRALYEPDHRYLLPSDRSPTGHVVPYTISHWLGLARELADLDDVGWHTFRHTWATRIMATGKVSLRTLQKLGRWQSLEMVQRYAHVERSEMERAVDMLDD